MHAQPPFAPQPRTRPLAAGGFALATIGFLSMGRAALDPDAAIAFSPAGIALTSSAGVASLALCAAFAQPARLRDTLALNRPEVSLGILLLCATGLIGVSILAKSAVVWSGAYDGSGLEMLDGVLAADHASAALILVAAFAIAPGIAEELRFRGAIFGSLQPRCGPGAALTLSALLFGAFHIDPAHIAGAIPLGLYLGAVRVVTGSTLAAILCHIANNGLAVALGISPGPLAYGMALVGLICLVPSVVWLVRNWPKRPPVATPPTGG